jgi:hypothetical protein
VVERSREGMRGAISGSFAFICRVLAEVHTSSLMILSLMYCRGGVILVWSQAPETSQVYK